MRVIRIAVVAGLVAASLAPLAAQQVYKAGNGVSLPSVVNKVNPQYTEEAKTAHVQGNVILNATVRTDGTVADVKVVRSLDTTFGLDQQAVKALQQWTFKPGQREGKDVAVNLDFQINFTLK